MDVVNKVVYNQLNKSMTLDNMLNLGSQSYVKTAQLQKVQKFMDAAIGGARKSEALKQAGLTESKWRTLSKIHGISSPFLGDGAGGKLVRKVKRKSNDVKSSEKMSNSVNSEKASRKIIPKRGTRGGVRSIFDEKILEDVEDHKEDGVENGEDFIQQVQNKLAML